MSSPVPWADARAKLTAANLGVSINWPNEPFTEPSDAPALWLSVQTSSGTLMPIELGGGGWQEEGTLHIDVIAPLNQGTENARVLAKRVSDLFRGLANEPVVYLSAAIGAGGPMDPHGSWWVLPVSVDWKYQDTTVP